MGNKTFKRWIGFCCAFIMVVNLCGFSMFSGADPVLYTENNRLYATHNVNELISVYVKSNGGYEKAKELYDDHYIAVLGRVYSYDAKKEVMYLGSPDEMYVTTIKCTLNNKADKVWAANVSRTDYVLVYGRAELSSIFGSTSFKIDVDRIIPWNSSTISNTAYSFANGTMYDENSMLQKSLFNGRIKYRIPAGWQEVESKLANVEGYQYRLNEQTTNFRVEPESAFVFFFDNNRFLLNLSDKSKTGRIEDAIIENILQGDGSDGKEKEKESYFGIDFDYYTTYFRNNENKAYNVEFVFVPIEEEGFLVILYVFNEQVHTDQIRAVMRMLEIN